MKMNKSDYVRENILDAATNLFLKKGYTNTSMDEIAEAIGLTKGGLYYYIDKKEDIIVAMNDVILNSLNKKINHIYEDNIDVMEKLLRIVNGLMENVVEKQRETRILMSEIHNIPEENLSSIAREQKRIKNLFENTIIEGIKEGKFRKDVNPHIISLLIFGMVNWIYMWYKADGKNSFEDIKEELNKIIIASLATKEVTEKTGLVPVSEV